MPPDEAREPDDQAAPPGASPRERLATLQAMVAQLEARLQPRQDDATRLRPDAMQQQHEEAMARNRDTLARLEALNAPQRTLEPLALETTVAQAQRMTERQTHPTWMHAAYADLAQRLARVEGRLEELGDSMSLLHTKMEMIIGQLAIHERLDRGEPR